MKGPTTISCWLPAFLAAGLIVAADPVLAQPAASQPAASNVISEVRVTGNKRLSVNAILDNVKVRSGHVYDEAIIRGDEQRLLDTGSFSTVTVRRTQTPQGIVLTFDVVERPAIAKLEIVGNKSLTTDDLMKELGFGSGSSLSKYSAESGRQALLTKYRAEGYYFVDVTIDWKAYENQQIIYHVVEGPQVKIRKIKVEGNNYFSNLRLMMEYSSTARFWPFIKGYLDMDQVERDVNTIRNLYVADGFLDCEVAAQTEFSDDKKNVQLTFVIRENQRYRISEVVFKNNKVFSDEELLRRVRLKQGEFFTQLGLRRDLKHLQDTYGELGYIDANVDVSRKYLDPESPLPEWAKAKDLGPKPAILNLIYAIHEGEQFHVGQIVIRGNNITQSRVIRRELRFFPEQLYDTVAVDESKRQLLESRLFDEVTITPTGKEPGARDALVQVKEGRTADFMMGVGVSSRDGLLGNISFGQRNFDIFAWPGSKTDISHGEAWKGAGQTLRITAEPGLEMMRFSIDWTEPYLMDQPYALGTRLFLFNRAREKYDETRFGPVVSLGHTFKNRWYGELAGRIEDVVIDNLDSTAPPEDREAKGSNLLMGLKGTIARNNTDSRWMPTTGDSLRLSYEQVTGDWDFGKATGDYHIYNTLYQDALDRKHILAERFSFGQILGDAPVFEKFYGGGTGSIRGFKYRGISPRSTGTNDQIGGKFMVFAGSEYTFPLVAEYIRGVVFLDSGTVERDFEITTYRVSTGFGIRWVIPFLGPMPMSLDFGFPLAKSSEDDTQILSFNFGWTF